MLEHAPPLKYNQLHDFESLWWIVLYFILWFRVLENPTGVPVSYTGTEAHARLERQKVFAKKLFGRDTAKDREPAFIDPPHLVEVLADCLHPSMFKTIDDVTQISSLLLELYKMAERDMQDDVYHFKRIVNKKEVGYKICKHLTKLHKMFAKADVTIGRMDGP